MLMVSACRWLSARVLVGQIALDLGIVPTCLKSQGPSCWAWTRRVEGEHGMTGPGLHGPFLNSGLIPEVL